MFELPDGRITSKIGVPVKPFAPSNTGQAG
jgi:hypothetical protein